MPKLIKFVHTLNIPDSPAPVIPVRHILREELMEKHYLNQKTLNPCILDSRHYHYLRNFLKNNNISRNGTVVKINWFIRENNYVLNSNSWILISNFLNHSFLELEHFKVPRGTPWTSGGCYLGRDSAYFSPFLRTTKHQNSSSLHSDNLEGLEWELLEGFIILLDSTQGFFKSPENITIIK